MNFPGLKSFRAAIGQARGDLDSFRDRLVALREERDRIENLPCTPEEAERRLDQVLDAIRVRNPFSFATSLFVAEGKLDTELMDVTLRKHPFAVLLALLPDEVRREVRAQLPAGGITQADRVSKLAKIAADLETTEIAEEVACREIEETLGTSIPRREDARIEILLAPDRELGR
jgi:hypothetical protein